MKIIVAYAILLVAIILVSAAKTPNRSIKKGDASAKKSGRFGKAVGEFLDALIGAPGRLTKEQQSKLERDGKVTLSDGSILYSDGTIKGCC